LDKVAVFEDQAGNFVLLRQRIQHILRGGDGLAFAAAGRRGQAQVVKSTSPSCLGELMLKRRPASSKMRSPTRSSSIHEALGEAVEDAEIDAHAGLLHAEENRGERQVDLLVDALTPAFSTSPFSAGTSARMAAAPAASVEGAGCEWRAATSASDCVEWVGLSA
jgi:hypothetical protein